ncbi:STAS/SEC14 domain-containing protein [Pseudoxanthomonas sp. PXM02]|uniref:STAS/SEC14 domain-containing protein n=1 Tax=Pseudoxanthomonas sp. PXM02 TaxID=2769294 RepID=UPI001786C644|nr:STAS/SEC14 domain-containing protein [Pseudoxanthomonas sp. PXM02]MBD9478213.1 STAS/SEC14 domain-containing protein [Pseudoxanthomonas sp. PXM02]
MIEILASPPHVAAYRFTDELTGADYDACIADLESRLLQFPRIAVVSDISDLHGLSLDVVGKDLRYALSKRGEYDRFARAAVVTDKRWLVAVTGMADRIMPHTAMRTFAPEERSIALDWAAELDPAGED